MLLTWFNGGGRARPGWTMPGGGVEFDESIQDAVAREVFEETGYTVDVVLATETGLATPQEKPGAPVAERERGVSGVLLSPRERLGTRG